MDFLRYSSKKRGLKKEYIDFIKFLFSDDTCSFWAYNRKYYRYLIWEVNDFFGGDYDIDFLGYQKKGTKLKSLTSAYKKPELLQLGRETLESQREKKYISASFSFITGNKSKKKKSYCINSAVFTRDPEGENILTVFYRATEIPRKFGADLLFLRGIFSEYIPEDLRREIDKTIFIFTLAYVVPIYYPLVYTFGVRVRGKGKMAEACRHQLARAENPKIEAKYGPTRRVYEYYRNWRKEKKVNKAAVLSDSSPCSKGESYL